MVTNAMAMIEIQVKLIISPKTQNNSVLWLVITEIISWLSITSLLLSLFWSTQCNIEYIRSQQIVTNGIKGGMVNITNEKIIMQWIVIYLDITLGF